MNRFLLGTRDRGQGTGRFRLFRQLLLQVLFILGILFVPRPSSLVPDFSNAWAAAGEPSEALTPLHPVRVVVLQGAGEMRLGVSGAYRVTMLHTNEPLMEGSHLGVVDVQAQESGIQIGDRSLKVYGVRVSAAGGEPIAVNRRPFHGTVDIIRDRERRLLVINEIDVEQYLCGVLHRETSDQWPLEALKAQAIVARTFALHQALVSTGQDYHLTAGVASQVYGGRWAERRRTTMAVSHTEGSVLTWEGRLFPAYYHSCCGGHTEAADQLWKIRLPPLAGVADPHCRGTKHFQWTRRAPLAKVVKALRQGGYYISDVSSIRVRGTNRSGRITEVILSDTGRSKDVAVSGKVFRTLLGSDVVRSLRCQLRLEHGALVVEGYGWGHGVGMCQWGALVMAQQGRTAEEILAVYYPGAMIERFSGQSVVPEKL